MSVSVKSLDIPDVLVLSPRRFSDSRGYFLETWSKAAFTAIGIDADFVQDNQSLSSEPGTVRGLHYQAPPCAQAKLIRVLKGAIFDVAVDIRPRSPTFGRWCTQTLVGDTPEQLFIPRGFAHGFMTLEPDTIVAYKVDGPYSPKHEGGIRWDDPALAIPWPRFAGPVAISPKDVELPAFKDMQTWQDW